ncbi:MAG: response regulator transcription factor [Clostridiales bacterium]|nr:response regulator transcription factor [Clostridiales bacterium]
MRILVVEDEQYLNNIIVKRLKKEQYSVDSCTNGKDAIDYIGNAEYDAVILDIMLPEVDGMEVLQQMRKAQNHTPVLLLTAKDSVKDRVLGLDSGADDYLVKPFAFDELLARIRLIMRRQSNQPTNCFVSGDLSVNCDTRTVKRGDKVIALSSKEFMILEYLIRNKGIVLSRTKIEQHIWNYDYEGSSNIIDVYIRYLRKKIDDDFEPKLIQTVRGAGYMLRDLE